MNNKPVTAKELSEELSKHLPEICKELNKDKDITIKKKGAGKIQLVCQSQKAMN